MPINPTAATTFRARRLLWLAALAAGALALAACDQKMGVQPSFDPLEATTLFHDGRSARPAIEGTVARGHLRLDDALFTGETEAGEVTEFPMTITQEIIKRGQQRYNIYCSPCHGFSGHGDGMIVQRGFSAPPSFHEDRMLTAPVGHFYHVITKGYGRMYDYRAQVPVADRWAITAYIRALQLSQRATLEDIPPQEREKLAAGGQP